jgi:DtxR family manganese transport transcriptional regulator
MARSGKSTQANGRRGGPRPDVPGPDVQARGHHRTRRAHLVEVAEDYVETIADLLDVQGEARAVDLARRLGVSHVTVTKTVARLQEAGLVASRPYRAIFLTPAGRRLASQCRRRHRVVVELLRKLGVGEETARLDAEGMEHHISRQTLAAFERFTGSRGPRRHAPR